MRKILADPPQLLRRSLVRIAIFSLVIRFVFPACEVGQTQLAAKCQALVELNTFEHAESMNWVAVQEHQLSYPNGPNIGYIYIYIVIHTASPIY